jgi:hypothetical protein
MDRAHDSTPSGESDRMRSSGSIERMKSMGDRDLPNVARELAIKGSSVVQIDVTSRIFLIF